MKYTINSNSIDIEYIADSKRKKLKLNNDDVIDMDFFNQLIAAKPNKRDAMCELYRRKILKESDDDIIHIQPLKLDKELKPSKYAEKTELNRRKEELERDKKKTGEEAKNLVKDESKKKDVKSLNEEDLKDPNDKDKLIQIQSEYIKIEKLQQIIINQIDSLEISNADTVNIKELKNLTVNAFDTINKSLVDAKITDKDKEDIADKISNVIVPRLNNLNQLINRFSEITMNYIKESNAKSKEEREEFIEQYKQDFEELSNNIKTQLSELPKDNGVENVIEIVNEIKENLDNLPEIEEKIKNLDEAITKLPKVFNKQTIEKREIALEDIVTALKKNRDILDKKITDELINEIKTKLPDINPSINYEDFKKEIFKHQPSKRDKWKKYQPDTFYQFKDLAFIHDNYLYVMSDHLNEIKKEVISVTEQSLMFFKYSFDDIKNATVNNFINNVTLLEIGPIIHYNPNIYINGEINGKGHRSYGGRALDIPVFKIDEGNQDLIELLKVIQKSKQKSDGLTENENGGKIMIDLNKSTTDEKLNEIIRLLSQMNYNIFTTTPMYTDLRSSATRKNNRYKKQQNQEEKKSKGIDLYDVLNL